MFPRKPFDRLDDLDAFRFFFNKQGSKQTEESGVARVPRRSPFIYLNLPDQFFYRDADALLKSELDFPPN